ncbi:hypothetical protein dsx2_0583 [Desulfovibrio sp. X2]|uniref:hypothetical protein n=1 Tax=Desulfovibrio sp. X2 TaxID=941449 RepID=UPI000358C0AD|nr:hypothetical protein [Desulfovibrio sp. X2]EPR37651.1 hypothetical protein dsx2_0583 [Desulfovibrio sp. X2]
MADMMEDRELRILAAVHQAELGAGATPYAASFAKKGKSGLSFGNNQHDVANNPIAAVEFSKTLKNACLPDGAQILSSEEQNKTLALASRPGITARDFEREAPGLLDKVNQALDSDAGRSMVDQLDAGRDKVLDGYRRQIEEAARRNPAGPGVFDPSSPDYPQAMAMAVQWGNRTNGVDTIAKWAAGETVDLATSTDRPEKATSDGAPSLQGLGDYFAKTMYFRDKASGELPIWTQNHQRIAEEAKSAPIPESAEPGRGSLRETSGQDAGQDAGQLGEGAALDRTGAFLRLKSSIISNIVENESTPTRFLPSAGQNAGQGGPAANWREPERSAAMPRQWSPLASPGVREGGPGEADRAAAKRQLPPGYVAAFPERGEDDARPAFRTPPLRAPGITAPEDAQAMSTLDFIAQSFRRAAEGVPETARPRRPAGSAPSISGEPTTAQYLWDLFNPKAIARRIMP